MDNFITLPSGQLFNFISQMSFGEWLISFLIVIGLALFLITFVVNLLYREGFF